MRYVGQIICAWCTVSCNCSPTDPRPITDKPHIEWQRSLWKALPYRPTGTCHANTGRKYRVQNWNVVFTYVQQTLCLCDKRCTRQSCHMHQLTAFTLQSNNVGQYEQRCCCSHKDKRTFYVCRRTLGSLPFCLNSSKKVWDNVHDLDLDPDRIHWGFSVIFRIFCLGICEFVHYWPILENFQALPAFSQIPVSLSHYSLVFRSVSRSSPVQLRSSLAVFSPLYTKYVTNYTVALYMTVKSLTEEWRTVQESELFWACCGSWRLCTCNN